MRSFHFTEAQSSLFNKMSDFMLERNKTMNLTRITEPDDILEKHFVDSLLPFQLFNVPDGAKVADIGSGAGFPGVPWKIFRPDLSLTLIDSLMKRINYLNDLKEYLGLDYSAIHGRCEDLSRGTDSLHREKYGIVLSRAVASFPVLAEYCIPFVSTGGAFLAMKGKDGSTEAITGKRAVLSLGAEIENIIPYELPSGDKRNLIIVRKISHTPPKYPRKSINISKNPL